MTGACVTGRRSLGWARLVGRSVPRVLVVDDDADVRALLRDAFAEAGYAVDLAGDGKAALALLARGCPDAAVVDLMLPLLDGWHVVRAAAGTYCRGLPIVVVTGFYDPGEAWRELGPLGVYACVSKPFDVAQLVGMVGQ